MKAIIALAMLLFGALESNAQSKEGKATSGATTLTCKFSGMKGTMWFDNDGTRPDFKCESLCKWFNATGKVRGEHKGTFDVNKGYHGFLYENAQALGMNIRSSEASITCSK